MVVIVHDASTAETEQVKGKERHGEEAQGEPSNEGNPPTPGRNQFLCLLGKFPQHPQKLTSVMIDQSDVRDCIEQFIHSVDNLRSHAT